MKADPGLFPRGMIPFEEGVRLWNPFKSQALLAVNLLSPDGLRKSRGNSVVSHGEFCPPKVLTLWALSLSLKTMFGKIDFITAV